MAGSEMVVVDTGIFIDFLRAKNKAKTQLFQIADEGELLISSVTLYELLMGATTPEKLKDISTLTEDIPVLPFDESTANEAALIYHDLRKRNKMIEFRDLFIAATCVVNDVPLMTFNKKHFQRIKHINLV